MDDAVAGRSPFSSASIGATRTRASGEVQYSSFVIVTHSSLIWANFTEARDAAAQILPLARIFNDVNCSGGRRCTYLESVRVALDEAAIRRGAEGRGLDFKVFGQTLEVTISLPAEHLRLLLERLATDQPGTSAPQN
ncbi:hypothetical protein GXW71_21530 [Roseomonas hellenica]|uniref:Uncharacterized protein n=1 Tax=Plastoroseomonas hellenica TaxID=2687306 RepID=A0ABS5F360_9PROT|nr:hypothetical protein [Plastoroseomonas hellenica]MBR0666956.1 hypothetical protein [Plastoroseomonas hellenica]